MCRCFTARYDVTLMLIIPFYTVILSDRIVDRVKMCKIRSGIYGVSDHFPIVLGVAPAIASRGTVH